MGIFDKKKKPVTKPSGSGNYRAPSADVAKPVKSARHREEAAQQSTPQPASSKPAIATVPSADCDGTDVERPGAPAPIPQVYPAPTRSPTQSRDYDEPTVMSGDGDGTVQTYPTLKSAESSESKDSAFTITRDGQYLTLNGFANGHLMRWKFAAEEGPAIIRIPSVLLALSVIGTTLYPLISIAEFWTLPTVICAFHTTVLASLILILEGRVMGGVRSPTNFRARIRGVVTRYINVFRLLWGRGLLYLFVGSMNLTIDHPYVVYTGFPMIVLGTFAVGSGAHASYNLDRMKSSLTDEAYLWAKFETCDHDNDNYLDLNGFADLLWSVGLEFDDVYTFKAFQQIDRDNDSKVSFEEFKHWWIVTQNDGRKLRKV